MTGLYPERPGFKAAGTSAVAAAGMEGRAQVLRDAVVDLLKSSGPLTTDEAAERLGESVLAVRPRFSELRVAGVIVPTGERRRNASGMSANVWRVSTELKQADLL